MNKTIKNKIDKLPNKPGTYQMLDTSDKIIYVGKAKNLKNRVSSYFVGVHDEKTTRLVKEIEDFKYIITSSEKEALLLEINQIKKYKPKYNIQFMSDTTYPYIEITDELYPRLKISRNIKKNHKNCFGPFPDVKSARQTLKTLNLIFPFRKCDKMPKKVCLYYFIKQCLGPCEYEVDTKIYREMRKKVRSFLSGNTKEYIDLYKEKMEEHSKNLEFEKANEYKELIESIIKTTEKQQVVFNDKLDRDIVNFVAYDHYITINILFMRQGRLLFSNSKLFSYFMNPEEILYKYLFEYYKNNIIPNEIILPQGYDYTVLNDVLGQVIFTPQRGRKLKLLNMAKENAENYMNNNLNTFLKKENKTIGAISGLEKLLNMKSIIRIDAFDNSNTSGKDLVSAMVVFRNGLPDKKQYRKYKIKTIDSSDDYHMMQEVIYRRYQNVLIENLEKPDLIIVDGGIQQVNAAKEILKDLNLNIKLIGLKKDDYHKTKSIITSENKEILLDKRSNIYSLLYKIQEEVHRFAISFHHSVSNKKVYASILDTIPRVGKATKEKLLKKYKNLENIKNASREELKALKISEEAINNIYMALKDKNKK